MNDWHKKREVMKRYDQTAHMYDMRYAEEQNAKFEAALKSLNMAHYGSVLDVGCGTGLLFSRIAAKAETIVALDTSKKTLFYAKQNARSFPNVHLILADADNMPLKEKAFDLVFGFTLIQNMPDPKKSLNEIKRVAKSHATIVITGLKKKFTAQKFKKLLQVSGLKASILEDDDLKCHVAICNKRSANKND